MLSNMHCNKYFFIVTLAIVSGISGFIYEMESRILGGSIASSEDFRFLVAIWRGIPICGGTIVSPQHVLTAGHCVDGTDPHYLHILAGVSSLGDRNGIKVRVLGYMLHPEYKTPSPSVAYLKNDIAMIKLTSSLDTTAPNVAVAQLPKFDLQPGTVGVSAGWGDLNSSGKQSLDLYKAAIRVWPLAECQAKYSWHTADQFCGAGEGVMANMCSGDSGGPLIVDDAVVGVISISTCSLYGTVTYAKVYSHLSFIRRALSL